MIEFEAAAALARSGGLLFLEIDALHMLAIADRARARERAAEAIDRALAAPDDRTRRWLVSLYNNLGCSYSEAGDLDQALAAFLQAQGWAERVGTEQQQAWAREAIQERTAARRTRDAGEPGFRQARRNCRARRPGARPAESPRQPSDIDPGTLMPK